MNDEIVCKNEDKDGYCLIGASMWFHIENMGFNENYMCVNHKKCFRFIEKT